MCEARRDVVTVQAAYEAAAEVIGGLETRRWGGLGDPPVTRLEETTTLCVQRVSIRDRPHAVPQAALSNRDDSPKRAKDCTRA